MNDDWVSVLRIIWLVNFKKKWKILGTVWLNWKLWIWNLSCVKCKCCSVWQWAMVLVAVEVDFKPLWTEMPSFRILEMPIWGRFIQSLPLFLKLCDRLVKEMILAIWSSHPPHHEQLWTTMIGSSFLSFVFVLHPFILCSITLGQTVLVREIKLENICLSHEIKGMMYHFVNMMKWNFLHLLVTVWPCGEVNCWCRFSLGIPPLFFSLLNCRRSGYDFFFLICRSFQVGREKFLIPWLLVVNRKSTEVPMINVELVMLCLR